MALMSKDPVSGMILPTALIDQRTSLKAELDKVVDNAVNSLSHLKDTYYLTIHAKFDKMNPEKFTISEPVASLKLPGFISNSFVFWVNNSKGICELLWMVPPKKPGEKLKVEFNKKGVAYLQAKGAMPS